MKIFYLGKNKNLRINKVASNQLLKCETQLNYHTIKTIVLPTKAPLKHSFYL